tara:strand:+ start:1391 stop:2344 length:954 start_codon:yes stop_codon:yes gene_type:complete
MAFKMRSGNKVSFKNMGGSPAKQDDGLINVSDTQSEVDLRKRQDLADQRASDNYIAGSQDGARSTKTKKSGENILSVENRSDKTLKDLREYNVKKEQKASGRKKALTEGANVTDKDTDKYKSKAQINQEKKTRNVERRQMEYGSDERKTQRVKDKDATIKDKLQRAKGTGRSTMTFNWKDALVGGDLSSGMRYEPAHEVLKRKQAKRKTKAITKAARKTGREAREVLKPGTMFSRAIGGKGSGSKREKVSNLKRDVGVSKKEARLRVNLQKARDNKNVEKAKKIKAKLQEEAAARREKSGTLNAQERSNLKKNETKS